MFKHFQPSAPHKRKFGDRDACSSPNVDVVTNDGVHFCLPKNIAEQMGILKHVLDENDDNQFTLPLVNAPTFGKIMEYCSYVVRDSGETYTPEPDARIRFTPQRTFEATFLDAPLIDTNPSVFDLLQAADYLDVPRFVDLCSANICNAVLKSSPDTLRRDFRIDESSEYFAWTELDKQLLKGGRDGGGETKTK